MSQENKNTIITIIFVVITAWLLSTVARGI